MDKPTTTKESNMNHLLTRTQARSQARRLSRTTKITHVSRKSSFVPVKAFLNDEDFGESRRVHGYTVVMRGAK